MLAALHTALRRSALLLLLAAPAAAATVPAPQGMRTGWSTFAQERLPFRTKALLGGDTMVLYRIVTSTTNGFIGSELERLDASGAPIWTLDLSGVANGVPDEVAFDEEGRCALLYDLFTSMTVRVYDADGALMCARVIEPTVGGGLRLGRSPLAFSDNGALLVALEEWPSAGPSYHTAALQSRAINPTTGTDVWVRTLVTDWVWARIAVDPTGGAMAFDLDESAPADTARVRFWRIDRTGNLAVDSWIDLPWSGDAPRTLRLDVDPRGRQAVCSIRGGPTSSSFFQLEFSVDRDGLLRWTIGPAPDRTIPIDFVFLTGGDVAAITSDGSIVRVDPTGAVSSHPGNPAMLGGRIFALRDGGYMLVVQTPFIPRVRRFGADNALRSIGTAGFADRFVFGGEGLQGRIVLAGHLDYPPVVMNGWVYQLVEESAPPSTLACEQDAPNSSGRTGKLVGFGSDDVASNDLSLLFFDLPPSVALLPVASQTAGSVPNPGGSVGTLCLGGAIGRYPAVLVTTQFGTSRALLDLGNLPTPQGPAPALAGETWFFQGWHRDVDASGPTSNLTDAIAVSF